uniref:Single-stranded DNA-binding protein n=1 Tax=Pseudomonas phage HRDY3 TaxID=3236930 RepID=A0AB39CDS9_9VIRU
MKAPALKEIQPRELFVVGNLKTGEVLEVYKLKVPKQGMPQFKNQAISLKAFRENEKGRMANGAWYGYTIFSELPEYIADTSQKTFDDTQTLFRRIGYTSKQKRYDANSTAVKMEDPAQRAETSENSVHAANSCEAAHSSAATDLDAARP